MIDDRDETHGIDRRRALAIGAGAVAALTGIDGRHVALAANESADLIAKFTGGRGPTAGRVTLDLPELAENGSSVPLKVTVDSPMTEASHVTQVLIVAEGNPRGGIATVNFSPAGGVAEAHMRIRLSGTQNVVAVAKMNDGACFIVKREVKVTIGGCAT
jgi:sulfur-oxidizing protein SoxY